MKAVFVLLTSWLVLGASDPVLRTAALVEF